MSGSSRRNFNPHTREGCDYKGLPDYRQIVSISIHTPVKGVTPKVWQSPGISRISIHTPVKGVTLRTVIRALRRCYFNPHTREGCDSDVIRDLIDHYKISIHTPVKGVTFTPSWS